MRTVASRTAGLTILVMLLALVVVAPAAGASVTSRQIVPGMTERTIWDSAQVACYRLPDGVNHNGAIHFELTFQPAWADFDVYLLDGDGEALAKEMGYMASFVGKEVVDHTVTTVVDQTIATGDLSTTSDGFMVGDTYYVVVVAFNETARFRLWGYYPQIDLTVGPDTAAPDNYYLKGYSRPAAANKWITLDGPNYGHPYDFTPTSVGAGEVHLEWPADIGAREVTYNPLGAPSPANMESYLYAGNSWATVFEDFGDGNWTPPPWGEPPLSWYGLRDVFEVTEGSVLGRPMTTMHYVPSLYLVADDPAVGWPPRLGRSTLAYKATLMWPENLRFRKAPTKVKKGARATLKGSFALDFAWQAGATVRIEKSLGGGRWKTVETVTTGVDGAWTARVKITAATTFRAHAVGDAASGLADEYSVVKRVRVY